jgi:hypothetical protein
MRILPKFIGKDDPCWDPVIGVYTEETDGDKLQLSPEGWEYLADLKWVNQEYNLGHWNQYVGNYIAVYKKQLLGFGPDLIALRERVTREYNISPDRILTEYIDPGPIT